MKSCLNCNKNLYSAVAFCPFCAVAQTAAGRKAANAVPVPPKPVAPEPVRAAVSSPATPVPPPPVPVAEPAASAAPQVVEQRGVPFGALPPPAPARKKGGKGKWIVGAAILAVILFNLRSKPDQGEVACNAAFAAGTSAVASKDLATARVQATTANGVCVGASRSKATSLQAAIDAAEKSSTACLRSFRTIESHMEDHKLASARTALNGLSSTCSADADAATWRTKLAEAVTAAQGAQAALRTALDGKDLAQAKAGLQQLVNANRENADLPGLKGEVDQLAKDVAAAATAAVAAAPPVETPAAVPVVAIPPAPAFVNPRAPEPVRAPVRRSEPDTNPKAEMATAFLRDAETALAQKKFDAARTYVDSARRMDPGNPRLDSLTQQIRDRERQVLQQETIIR